MKMIRQAHWVVMLVAVVAGMLALPMQALAATGTATRTIRSYAVAPDGHLFPVSGVRVVFYRIFAPPVVQGADNRGDIVKVGECTTGADATCQATVPVDDLIAVSAYFPTFYKADGTPVQIPPQGWATHGNKNDLEDVRYSWSILRGDQLDYGAIEGTYLQAPVQTAYYDEYGQEIAVVGMPYAPNPVFLLYFEDVPDAWDGDPPLAWTSPDIVAPIFPVRESDIVAKTGEEPLMDTSDDKPDTWLIDPARHHGLATFKPEDVEAGEVAIRSPFLKTLMTLTYMNALQLDYQGDGKWDWAVTAQDAKLNTQTIAKFLAASKVGCDKWQDIEENFAKGRVLENGRYRKMFDPAVFENVPAFSPYYLGPDYQTPQGGYVNQAMSKHGDETSDSNSTGGKQATGGEIPTWVVVLGLTAAGWYAWKKWGRGWLEAYADDHELPEFAQKLLGRRSRSETSAPAQSSQGEEREPNPGGDT